MGKKISAKMLNPQQKNKLQPKTSKKSSQNHKKPTLIHKGASNQNSKKKPHSTEPKLQSNKQESKLMKRSNVRFQANKGQKNFPKRLYQPQGYLLNGAIASDEVKQNWQNIKSKKKQRLQESHQTKVVQKQSNSQKIEQKNLLLWQPSFPRRQMSERWRQSIARFHHVRMNGMLDQMTPQPKGQTELQDNMDRNSHYRKDSSNKNKQIRKTKIQNYIRFSVQNGPMQMGNYPEVIQISQPQQSQLKNAQEQSQLKESSSINLCESLKSSSSRRKKGSIGSKEIVSLFGKSSPLLRRSHLVLESQPQLSQDLSRFSSKSEQRRNLSAISISSESMNGHKSSQNRNPNMEKESQYQNYLIQVQSVSQRANHQNNHSFYQASDYQDQSSVNNISSPFEQDQYTVERIVSSKMKRGRTLYEIKWVGYPSQQNTFQPIKNLKNVLGMVVEFQNGQKNKNKQLLNQKQKLLSQKNREIQTKSRQLSQKNKKMEEMKKTIEQLRKRVKQLQKENGSNLKTQPMKMVKTDGTIKLELLQQNKVINRKNLRSNRSNYKNQEQKLEQEIIKIYTDVQVQKVEFGFSQEAHKVVSSGTNSTSSRQSVIFQNPIQIEETLIQNNKSNIGMRQIQDHDKDLSNIEYIDFFDSHPHYSKQLETVSFTFKEPIMDGKELHMIVEEGDEDKSENIVMHEQQRVLLNLENHLENQSLIDEFDCLKYLSTE